MAANIFKSVSVQSLRDTDTVYDGRPQTAHRDPVSVESIGRQRILGKYALCGCEKDYSLHHSLPRLYASSIYTDYRVLTSIVVRHPEMPLRLFHALGNTSNFPSRSTW